MTCHNAPVRVRRYLGKFKPNEDHFEAEIDVTHVPLEDLRRIFSYPNEDPLMYYSYNLNREQAEYLQKYVKERFDLDRFNYQLQAEAAD